MFPKSDREDVMSKTTTTSRVLRPGDLAQTPFSSLGRKVAYASSCRLNNSARFDAKPVVYSDSQTLLAANVALRRLHRDMPEKELDLLKLAARIMAESRTGASEIVWSKTWNVHTRGCLFDHVPDRLF